MKQHQKIGMLRPALLATSIALLVSGHAMAEQVTFHNDTHRSTPKLIIEPAAAISSDMNEDLAHAYVNDQFRRFGINQAQNLKLTSSRKSLLGTHYHFQQYVGKVMVDGAEMIVTIANDGHTISKVFNSTHKTTPRLDRLAKFTVKPSISSGKAIDNAWNILQVRDKLTSAPTSELVYFVDQKGEFHLSHRVHIAAEGDTGGRMMYIDANRGSLIHDYSTTLRRHGHMPTIAELSERKGPVLDRQEQTRRFNEQSITTQVTTSSAVATASAQVFDPDPRTELQNASLEDNSPASSFDAAYVSRTLQGVTLSGGVYSLSGQYVNITEIETPTRAPSTSTTGSWTAKRGNNAFNDANTYFHLDQNQRYIQSLGFKGATGIIERALRVDTDGVQGGDNSHYSYGGSTDYLAFGHGGVDDNEDADVILHEYGHALHRNINSNWSGGDTGAMGEGFGDYWAGSYSYSTAKGRTFNPDWVMSWDGHSSSSWAGRVMNLTASAQYDHSKTYAAHSTNGGVNGDELWSTPLFQALKELMTAGRDRSEMDKIILQAHFGLGSNLKMRDVATSIVATAEQLYPTGPHASVYRTHFERHGMIEAGSGGGGGNSGSALENGVAKTGLTGAKSNQQVFTLEVPAGATDLKFVTTGGSGDADLYVKFGSAPTTSSYTCRSWATGNGETCSISSAQAGTYHVLVNAYTAYSGMSLTGSFTAGGGGGSQVKFFETTTDVAIKDKKTAQSVLAVNNSGSNGTISVKLDIKHTYVGDLRIDLIAPGGAKTFRLKNTSNDSSDNILKTYSVNASGVSYNGNWTLKVYDAYNGDTGKIDSWSITLP